MATIGFHRLTTRLWPPPLRSPLSRLHCACSFSFSEEASSVSAKEAASSSSPSFFPKRGQQLELVCETLAFKGIGVCKVLETGFVVMCNGALPGERFIGRVSRKKGNYAEVKKVQTVSPHWDIVDAPCEYAEICGGCKTQNLLYDAQVRAKEQQVHELMIHVGRFPIRVPEFANVVKPIVPCDIQFHYRNKHSSSLLMPVLCQCLMEFSFGTKKWLPRALFHEEDNCNGNGYALGLHAPGFFDKVLHIEKCLLQSEAANKVLATIQESWRDPLLGLTPYDVHTHKGFLKHLMIRLGRDVKTGLPELMVNFVTSSYNPDLLRPLIQKLTTIPEMAEVLYKLIEECAGLRGDGSENVLDLFCGTGTIGLTLAKKVKHVYGYEVVAQAVADARQNAKINNICNAAFIQGDLNKINDNFGKDFPSPDIIILDPNRPGLHMKLIKFLLWIRAARIIYVSCNPATCARDIDYLCHGMVEHGIKGCYQLKSLQPVDMFPHTPHIECVCLLELR
ncbi:uncharacterized protein LOC18443678 isoform X3 [Amborella trichopoda]|uniref:uncharacterized protein LOC18443678 isoform X3 n=1 Tax=Amborella trichopoda TaxID=13333 RepID=UPI0009BEB783|nr:uncharacterized protein LOC18443678 isoform X3 [Amborella trichopoda]|eukprot:XP_020528901.1 uncharacterized protein LOC18443678 isoform X3 [Amborella trichopoda]